MRPIAVHEVQTLACSRTDGVIRDFQAAHRHRFVQEVIAMVGRPHRLRFESMKIHELQ